MAYETEAFAGVLRDIRRELGAVAIVSRPEGASLVVQPVPGAIVRRLGEEGALTPGAAEVSRRSLATM